MFGKIGLKLILGVGLSTIAIIVVFAIVSIQSQSEILLAELEHHNDQLGQTIKSSTRFDMLMNNRDHLHQIINMIGSDSSILEVRVFNKEGVVIYSSDPSQIGVKVDTKGEACYTCHATDEPLSRLSISERTRIFRSDSERVMGTINPIYNEPSCYESDCHAHASSQSVLGVIDITESLAQTDRQIESAKWKMLIFAISAIVLISAVLSYFVWIWIVRPVRALVEATKHVASGNLSYRVENGRDDELGALALSFNNMTKKLAEARLQLFQSDKMASLGRLAAGVAHEINNPLTGILTYSSFLLKRTKAMPEIHEDLQVIVNETKRSREIVKGLLDFARQSVPKKRSAQLTSIIDRSITVLENQLTLNQIKLMRDDEPGLPEVDVDENQLQQVFINLIVNAIHASEIGGEIKLSTQMINLPPYGIAQIKSALCPKGHNLVDQSVRIRGRPSIRLAVQTSDGEGAIHLDSVYGKNRNQYDLRVTADNLTDVCCHKCQRSLLRRRKKCPKCGGPIYTFETPGKGEFEGCAIETCDWQHWGEIEAEGLKTYVEIRVSDHGCGIPEQNLSQIFDPFFTTKGEKGTGLGLSVIWGILDSHNGRISVESKVNQGTTFTIHIPTQEP